MLILVTYASKRGGTKGLADMVGNGLRAEGFTVEVAPAGTLWRVDQYDAVVVGGALYAGRWHNDARRFVKQYAHDLAERPTYLFSSGPLRLRNRTRDPAGQGRPIAHGQHRRPGPRHVRRTSGA